MPPSVLYVLSAVLGAAIFAGISRATPWVITRLPRDENPDTPDSAHLPPPPGEHIGTRVTGCYGRKHVLSPTQTGVLPSDKNLAFIVWPVQLCPTFDRWPPPRVIYAEDLRVLPVRGDTAIAIQSKALLNLIGTSLKSLNDSLLNHSMVLAFAALLILDRRP